MNRYRKMARHETLKPLINKAFKELRENGFWARQNWQCCTGCGCAAIEPEMIQGKRGWVFYHLQESSSLRDGADGVYLAWGGPEGESDIEKIGHGIVGLLKAKVVGLGIAWDGSAATKIWIGVPGLEPFKMKSMVQGQPVETVEEVDDSIVKFMEGGF